MMRERGQKKRRGGRVGPPFGSFCFGGSRNALRDTRRRSDVEVGVRARSANLIGCGRGFPRGKVGACLCACVATVELDLI